MLLASEFIQVQQEALALAAQKGISFEDAVREITRAKEKQQERQRQLELELIESMSNRMLAAYDEVKKYAPIVKEKLKDFKI
jgi:hypothetical protein